MREWDVYELETLLGSRGLWTDGHIKQSRSSWKLTYNVLKMNSSFSTLLKILWIHSQKIVWIHIIVREIREFLWKHIILCVFHR